LIVLNRLTVLTAFLLTFVFSLEHLLFWILLKSKFAALKYVFIYKTSAFRFMFLTKNEYFFCLLFFADPFFASGKPFDLLFLDFHFYFVIALWQ